MLFNSIIEIISLWKEIDKLLSKGMSNIYVKVTIEKILQTYWILKILVATEKLEVWEKPVCGFSIILFLKRIMTF